MPTHVDEDCRNCPSPRTAARPHAQAASRLESNLAALLVLVLLFSGSPVAAQTVPAKTVPAKTVPAKTVPAKTVPAKTVPAKTNLAPIVRRVPPAGIKLSARQVEPLRDRLSRLQQQIGSEPIASSPLQADIAVLLKSVDYALRHGEFYRERDVKVAGQVLDLAAERVELLAAGQSPWTRGSGLIVRGYRSSIDGSPQPYGLVVPEKLDTKVAVPLYVWLHGRGDKVTDLHFIAQRMRSAGNVAPDNAIVLHPFGRQCMGFKSAGEIDVLEAIEHVKSQYKIDSHKIALMGFSMGGAGAWHLGAHYADRWVVVSPGAGFAETARYNRLQQDQYPARYEQVLWGLYDVPHYVRNLFNVPVIAYSGEKDKQIQAARVMEEAFQQEGKRLTHLIGPGMGHKYHPDTLKEILSRVDRYIERGLNTKPDKISLQTRTLRYNRMHWLEIEALDRHWRDSRADVVRLNESLQVSTINVNALRLLPPAPPVRSIQIDGQRLAVPATDANHPLRLTRSGGKWELKQSSKRTPTASKSPKLRKLHGLQGPIDDVFLSSFVVVKPTGTCRQPAVQRWVDFELAHLEDRWRALFRGELPVRRDVDITAADIESKNLILWGDQAANTVLAKLAGELPLRWDEKHVAIGGHAGSAEHHVPVLIFPNPLNPRKYIVLNSGPTFREGHDRTNSLQNPKLPDWALLDIRQPPSQLAAGKTIAAGFFDESWSIPQ